MGWSTYGLSQAYRYHLELTQLNCLCSCAGWKECMGDGLQFFECWRVWRWRNKPDLRQLLFFPCRPLVRFMSVSSATQMPIPRTVAPSAAAFMTWAPHCGTRWMCGVAPTPSAVASERPSKPWPTVAWAWPVRHGGWVVIRGRGEGGVEEWGEGYNSVVASKALKALACCCRGLASEMWRVGVVFLCVCGVGG